MTHQHYEITVRKIWHVALVLKGVMRVTLACSGQAPAWKSDLPHPIRDALSAIETGVLHYIYIYIYKWYEAMDGQDEYMKINILPVGNWEPWDPCCWQLNLLRAHLSPSCWWTSPIIAPGHTSYAYAHTHENVFYLFQCSALIYPFFHDVYLD